MKISTEKEPPPWPFIVWSVIALIMLLGAVTEYNPFSMLGENPEEGHYNDPTPSPYYYFMLRIIVCGWAIYGIYLNIKKIKYNYPTQERIQLGWRWFWPFLIIAILFNPIFILHLGKDAWLITDLIVIGIIIISFFLFRPYKTEIFCSKCNKVLKKGFYLVKKDSFSWDSEYYNYGKDMEFCVGCLLDLITNKYDNENEGIECDYEFDIEKSVQELAKKADMGN